MKVVDLSPQTQTQCVDEQLTIYLVQSPIPKIAKTGITIGHKRFTYQHCTEVLQGTNVSSIVVDYVDNKVDWKALLYLISRCRGEGVLTVPAVLYNKASGILYEDLCSKRVNRKMYKKVVSAVLSLKIEKGE